MTDAMPLLNFAADPSSLIPLLSLLGLVISLYVWRSQRSGRPIACWTRDCDRVIRSPYSRLLGVHNSAIGIWVFLMILLLTLFPQAGVRLPPYLAALVSALLILLSSVGTLVSLYLAYVQLFVLKGICNWCLTSALLICAILIILATG